MGNPSDPLQRLFLIAREQQSKCTSDQIPDHLVTSVLRDIQARHCIHSVVRVDVFAIPVAVTLMLVSLLLTVLGNDVNDAELDKIVFLNAVDQAMENPK
jgi:hypothetical protein